MALTFRCFLWQVTLMDQFVWGTSSGQPFTPGQPLYVWIKALDVNLLQVCGERLSLQPCTSFCCALPFAAHCCALHLPFTYDLLQAAFLTCLVVLPSLPAAGLPAAHPHPPGCLFCWQ